MIVFHYNDADVELKRTEILVLKIDKGNSVRVCFIRLLSTFASGDTHLVFLMNPNLLSDSQISLNTCVDSKRILNVSTSQMDSANRQRG